MNLYGKTPHDFVLVHGGPGAQGDLKGLAELLKTHKGIFEPIQKKNHFLEQVDELENELLFLNEGPYTLVGHSWGSILSLMVASKNPTLIKKLILVGVCSFDDEGSLLVSEAREKKMKAKLDSSLGLEEIGKFYKKLDSYELISNENPSFYFDLEQHLSVWNEFIQFRKKGMLSIFEKIKCPILLIHGENDPHPLESAKAYFLKAKLSFFVKVLKKCGHYPWEEKWAQKEFLEILIQN